jgi:hypothetical protein
VNEAERHYLPRFCALEMQLYRELFGRDAVPERLKPALTEWMPDWRAVAKQMPPVLPQRGKVKHRRRPQAPPRPVRAIEAA